MLDRHTVQAWFCTGWGPSVTSTTSRASLKMATGKACDQICGRSCQRYDMTPKCRQEQDQWDYSLIWLALQSKSACQAPLLAVCLDFHQVQRVLCWLCSLSWSIRFGGSNALHMGKASDPTSQQLVEGAWKTTSQGLPHIQWQFLWVTSWSGVGLLSKAISNLLR